MQDLYIWVGNPFLLTERYFDLNLQTWKEDVGDALLRDHWFPGEIVQHKKVRRHQCYESHLGKRVWWIEGQGKLKSFYSNKMSYGYTLPYKVIAHFPWTAHSVWNWTPAITFNDVEPEFIGQLLQIKIQRKSQLSIQKWRFEETILQPVLSS